MTKTAHTLKNFNFGPQKRLGIYFTNDQLHTGCRENHVYKDNGFQGFLSIKQVDLLKYMISYIFRYSSALNTYMYKYCRGLYGIIDKRSNNLMNYSEANRPQYKMNNFPY